MFSLICKFFHSIFFSRYAGPHFTKIPLLKTPTRLELNGSLDLSRPESINQQIPNMSCKSSTIKPKNNLKVKPKAPMSKEEIKAQQLLKAMGKHRKKYMAFWEARHFLHHRLNSLIRQTGHKYKTFYYENQILNNTFSYSIFSLVMEKSLFVGAKHKLCYTTTVKYPICTKMQ